MLSPRQLLELVESPSRLASSQAFQHSHGCSLPQRRRGNKSPKTFDRLPERVATAEDGSIRIHPSPSNHLELVREAVALSILMPSSCEGGGDVVGVVAPLVRGVAQAFHDDRVVELRVQLAVQEVEGKEEDRKGQVEVEEEKRLWRCL